jgi:hypothetical protein
MSMSPTQLSLRHLRKRGYVGGIVERFNSFVNKRFDLFGFIDIVAMKKDEVGVTGIQTTTLPNLSSHLKKAKPLEELRMWLEVGNRVEFHGWRKSGQANKRKLWKPRVMEAFIDLTGNISFRKKKVI